MNKNSPGKKELEVQQASRLREMLQAIVPSNGFYQRKLQGFDPATVQSLADLRRLPFTSKQELLDDQAAHPPYGTNLTYPSESYCRLHQTSGTRGRPLRWLDNRASWEWFMRCWWIKYEMIGLKAADRLFFPFSFGPFIGFWAAFEAAARRDNLVMAGGSMTSVARLRFLIEHQATVVCCTPTYALRLAQAASAERIDLAASAVRTLIVAGEPGGSVPSTRRRIEEAWGARVFDHTGMTEVGSLGMECRENPGGVHMLETECIPEIIDPASGDPVRTGEEGELVLTNLGRWGSPLIRYRTGDRVRADPDPCPCGRPYLRLKGGILGRTDDMVLIRGNNVYPSTIEEIVRRFAEVEEFRLIVDQSGPLASLRIELDGERAGADLPDRLSQVIRDELHFRPVVTLLPPGSLPRAEMKSQRVLRQPG